jgi:hypothetical protein
MSVVGSHPRPLFFWAVASWVAVNRGEPPYPERFRKHALSIAQGTISTSDLTEAVEQFPELAASVPVLKQMFRNYGLPDLILEQQLLQSFVPALLPDACMAIPLETLKQLAGSAGPKSQSSGR